MSENKKEQSANGDKKTYETPCITTEDLLTFGAVCNGTTQGSRKETTSPSPPPACNAARLKS
jgi:hypothetical protein